MNYREAVTLQIEIVDQTMLAAVNSTYSNRERWRMVTAAKEILETMTGDTLNHFLEAYGTVRDSYGQFAYLNNFFLIFQYGVFRRQGEHDLAKNIRAVLELTK